MSDPFPSRVDDVDWGSWTPTEVGALVFVVVGDRILLIHKKRGLGAGKVNAPGGRLEEGEAPRQAAVREVEEEVGVVPRGIRDGGVVRFHFRDGLRLQVHVFTAAAVGGEPVETDEAAPFWVDRRAIPFDEMWPDDRVWLPLLLAGRPFEARFVYDGEGMLDWDVRPRGVDRRQRAGDAEGAAGGGPREE